MSCSDPSCKLFTKPESPYRAPAMMPKEIKEDPKPKKPSKILKSLGFAGKMVLGSILLAAICAALYAAYWAIFPGVFRVGVHVADYMGWDIANPHRFTPDGQLMNFWAIGALALVVPVLAGYLVYYLGNAAWKKVQA